MIIPDGCPVSSTVQTCMSNVLKFAHYFFCLFQVEQFLINLKHSKVECPEYFVVRIAGLLLLNTSLLLRRVVKVGAIEGYFTSSSEQ